VVCDCAVDADANAPTNGEVSQPTNHRAGIDVSAGGDEGHGRVIDAWCLVHASNMNEDVSPCKP
jgi:hypothetical protein